MFKRVKTSLFILFFLNIMYMSAVYRPKFARLYIANSIK